MTNLFPTREECENYITTTFGALYLEQNIVTAVKVGPTIARHLGLTGTGYAASVELNQTRGV